jgi:hypothetical protein
MARRDDDDNPLADVESYDMAEELADRMRLAPKDRMTFIDNVMTRCGYVPVQSRDAYTRAETGDDDERDDGGRWGFGGSQRGGSQRGGSQRSGNQRGGNQRQSSRRHQDNDPDKF